MSAVSPESLARFRAEEADRRAFEKWSRRTNAGIPALAARIFALRHTGYYGCGFHYDMERSLGALIVRLNDHSNPDHHHGRAGFAHRALTRMAARRLYADVVKAEESRGAFLCRSTQPPEAQADAPRTQDAGGDDGC